MKARTTVLQNVREITLLLNLYQLDQMLNYVLFCCFISLLKSQ